MATLESLTVEQLAELCGLKRNETGHWCRPTQPRCTEPTWVCVMRAFHGPAWEAHAYPYAPGEPIASSPSEHGALLALARHLNLSPKDDPMPKYKPIWKTPNTDAYSDYQPREGDELVFHGGERWRVVSNGYAIGARSSCVHAVDYDLLSLTTRIERPIKVIDVKGPGYEPQVGDVLCGPDGPVLCVVSANPPSLARARCVYKRDDGMHLSRSIIDLATRIEREA